MKQSNPLRALLSLLIISSVSTHALQSAMPQKPKGTIVIPAGGLGTRFLPITQAIPKEMLPILNLPAVHYIIDEGKKANFTDFALVLSKTKQAIKDYLSNNEELEALLAQHNKSFLIAASQQLIKNCSFSWHDQHKAMGTGHAILCARSAIAAPYFAVLYPDDLLANGEQELATMWEYAHKHNASVIAVQEVPQEHISSYGVIKPINLLDDTHCTIAGVVEKPKEEDAPSSFAIIGRYVLSSDIFPYLEKLKPSANGEYQLTDAIEEMITDGYTFIAHKITTPRFDIGTPKGWLDANNYLNSIQQAK